MQIGRYEVEKELGRGGMGVVCLAKDPLLERYVAIKQMLGVDEGRDDVKRFIREAQSVARLNVPGIVQIYDVGFEDNSLFIVMEYVDGQPLSSLIRGVPPEKQVLERRLLLYEKIIAALKRAHDSGIIHRDIKSNNIMVTYEGDPKILDFGLACIDGDHSLTGQNRRMGTPAYMAPEQISDSSSVDQRADIFSLGIVGYELLTGSLPYSANRLESLYGEILYVEPTPPRQRNEAIPESLDSLILHMLQKNPEERYKDLGDVLADLRVILQSFSDADGETLICPQCQSPISGDSRFCKNCGTMVCSGEKRDSLTKNSDDASQTGNDSVASDSGVSISQMETLPETTGPNVKDSSSSAGESGGPTSPKGVIHDGNGGAVAIITDQNDKHVGDIVTFGSYPQTASGQSKPIEWLILRRASGYMLLISVYALDCRPYHEVSFFQRLMQKYNVDWSACTLRQWLNTTFLNEAFSEEEKSKILISTIKNPASQWNDTSGGLATRDSVFLLSHSEVLQLMSETQSRRCRPTEYAVSRGVFDHHGFCWWWLRSPGDLPSRAACVYNDGVIDCDHVSRQHRIAVRPVIKLIL